MVSPGEFLPTHGASGGRKSTVKRPSVRPREHVERSRTRGDGPMSSVPRRSQAMAVHTNKKGLDLPMTGAPKQSIEAAAPVTHVAVVADDFVFMKPRMAVKVGETVQRGQLLFEDRKQPGVRHCAPGAGTVIAVNRGRYRALQSVVIELSESELSDNGSKLAADEHVTLESWGAVSGKKPEALSREAIVALLVESGVWTSIRKRPFGQVPAPTDAPPFAVFVNGADSNPGAADPDVVLADATADFERGLSVVAKLTEGKTYLCKRAGSKVSAGSAQGITVEEFAGPHPSGTSGYHIHTLAPAGRERTVWYLNYQDAVAIGRLFGTGRIDVERVIAFSGPSVVNPRLLRTRQGAFTEQICEGQLKEGENRIISGSVLSGRKAMGELHGFLGRYDLQISALAEDRERVLFGWMTLGKDAYSTSGIYVSALDKKRKFDLTTNTNGSHRAMVPIGMYERVFPFDLMPTFLLRALLSKDLSRAEELGALELDAEDLALCTFVCPGKEEYGTVLRENLETIWKEG